MEENKEKILNLINELDEMIKDNIDKKHIEIKRKELDKLLNLYLKDI